MPVADVDDALHLARAVIRTLPVGIVVMDDDFNVTSVNPAFSRIAKAAEAELVGKPAPFMDLLRQQTTNYRGALRQLRSPGHWEGELSGRHEDGTEYLLQASISRIDDEAGNFFRYGAIVTDVTERRNAEERIRHQANFDALTGLPNRALLLDRLAQSLATVTRASAKMALMFIDLDGFKLVNDTLGHDMGDELLREAANRVMHCVRTGDTVARLGGDEFTVIMPNLKNARDVPAAAQRILDALAKPFMLGGAESFVSGSIGITLFPDDATEAGELLKNADAAMYRAKDLGKANFQFFTADLNEEVRARLRIKNGLVKAMERGEFQLFYQPKLTLETGRIESVEALMRWDNGDLGMVSPARFIPVLEETGMVVDVGAWAIRTACEQHRAWLGAGLPPIRVAVNLSARQLREISFVSVLKRVLDETGVGPDGLEIEITESMLMSDAEGAVMALRQLHELGIHVAMDDFGTGYSSLSYLRRFPIDTIKIDQSFVADITSNVDDATIIRTIINMGRTLNRKVVAEGVETQAQMDMLKEYGCDQIQGYLLSRPLPADDVTRYLHECRREN